MTHPDARQPPLSPSILGSASFTPELSEALRTILDKLIVLTLALPAALLTLLFAAWIRTGSKGPVFYREWRVGQGGTLFTIYKLRTMHVNAEKILENHLQESAKAREEWARFHKLVVDPRIGGPAAHVARKYSVDELPQLFNVLIGDMHLVGPRAVEPAVRPYFSAAVWDQRLRLRPGVTGLWQVHGRAHGMRTMERYDRLYLQKRSLRLDFLILLRTPFALFADRGRA